MAAALNLAHAHRTRRHGDLRAVYTWLGEERALVLIPALRRGAAWFVVAESAAFRYDDPTYLARQSALACEVLGLEPTTRNALRVASIVHEGLPDLIRMPAAPLVRAGPEIGSVALRIDAQAVSAVAVQASDLAPAGVAYG